MSQESWQRDISGMELRGAHQVDDRLGNVVLQDAGSQDDVGHVLHRKAAWVGCQLCESCIQQGTVAGVHPQPRA